MRSTPVVLKGGIYDGTTGETVVHSTGPRAALHFLDGSATYVLTKRTTPVVVTDERTGQQRQAKAVIYQWDDACPMQARLDAADAEAKAEVAATRRQIITTTEVDEGSGIVYESKSWEQ